MTNASLYMQDVANACKEMNNARRKIINELNEMKATYSSINFDKWSGATRMNFHEKVFGKDGETGLVGKIGTQSTEKDYGYCKGLNDLLYLLAFYACEVGNADEASLPQDGYQWVPDFFVGDYKVTVQNVTVAYNQINKDIKNIYSDVIYDLEDDFLNHITNIKGLAGTFNTELQKCIDTGIENSSPELKAAVDGLKQVKDYLINGINAFEGEIKNLLSNNQAVLAAIKGANEELSYGVAQAQKILSNINFDAF